MIKKFNFIKILLVECYVIIAQLIWHCKDYVLNKLMNIPNNTIPYYIYSFGLGIILTLVLIAIVVSFTKSKNSQKGIINIGLKNSNGEYPRERKIFKDKTKENRNVYELETRNIPLTDFQSK